MNKTLHFQNLIEMLKEVNIEKNDSKTLREVLDYIAHELEQFIDYI